MAKLSNMSEFIEKAIQIHGDKYDYSKVEYINNTTKVCIICPIHGEFWIRPKEHTSCSQGCIICSGSEKSNTEKFIKRGIEIHGNKYDYSKVEYKNNSTKVCIICPKHGEFWQTPVKHLNNSQDCPKCKIIISKLEKEVCDFLKSVNVTIIQSDRKILNGLELDIFIPSHNLAIECDGLRWHSDKFGKDKNYHLNKTIECEKQGIQLIHIFEDEWLTNKEIVKNKLLTALNKHTIIIDSSKCKMIIDKSVKLYFENKCVSVLKYEKIENGIYKILDYVEYGNVLNGANIMFDFLKNSLNPKKIIGIADKRWSNGKLYNDLGFTFIKNNEPNVFYVYGGKRFINISDKNKKYDKIYDCGTIEYIYEK